MIQDVPYSAAITNTPVLVTGKLAHLVMMDAYHENAVTGYIQMFDAASDSDVILGTTTPDWVFPIPPSGGHDRSYTPNDYYQGVRFSLGLVIAATTTRAGLTALGATVDVNLITV
jgi:hypothetical protein